MSSISYTQYVPPTGDAVARADYRKALVARAGWLLKETNAYDQVETSKKAGSRCSQVANEMEKWHKAQQGMVIERVTRFWTDFIKEYKGWRPDFKKSKKQYAQMLAQTRDSSGFRTIPSHPTQHHRIEDSRGNLLAYRLRLPPSLLKELMESESFVPNNVKPEKHDRGLTINRHWALWKKYKGFPHYSSDYLRDYPLGAKQWFDANANLWMFLHRLLRNLDPKMYSKFNGVNQFLKYDRRSGMKHKPLAGPWFGLALNQAQSSTGNVHLDVRDYTFGLNIVISWGNYETSRLLLYPLELGIEMQPGDVVLFLGSVLAHGSGDIRPVETGRRNIIDCFAHDSVFDWCDRMRSWEKHLASGTAVNKKTRERIAKYGYFQRNQPTRKLKRRAKDRFEKGKGLDKGPQRAATPEEEYEDMGDEFETLQVQDELENECSEQEEEHMLDTLIAALETDVDYFA